MGTDMHKRRRIALLCAQPDEEYQRLFIEGVCEKAFAADYDVCIFAMPQKFQENELREIGEANIYNLVNFELFDAVLVMADTIKTPGTLSILEERLKDFKGKVLMIDKASEHFPSVFLEHYDPIVLLIEHLIDVHGYTDIAFLTGKKWHFHSKQRLQAFLDTMKARGLEVKPNRVAYGDYWFDGGENYVKELMKDPGDLPQAIACANDYMAIGVAMAIERYGLKIPDDIAVIGYDSKEDGRESPCPLTSANIPSRQFGAYSFQKLYDLMENRETPPFKPEYEMFIGGSCGCHCESMVPRNLLRQTWATDVSIKSLSSRYNRFLEDVLARSDFEGVMDTIRTYSTKLRPFDHLNICLNSEWAGLGKKSGIRTVFSDLMINVLSCGPKGEDDDRLQYTDVFERSEILPQLEQAREKPGSFWFLPLNFDSRSFGYIEIGYGEEIRGVEEDLFLWIRDVIFGLECIRREIAISERDQEIETRQITDSLTGLYNYEGFVAQSRPMIEQALLTGASIAVMAVDIINLSRINQKYGRKEGDEVISAVADMLREVTGEGGICCRLGNDEFVVALISSGNGTDDITEIEQKLYGLLKGFNEGGKYSLKLATGCNVDKPDAGTEMEKIVNAAVSKKNGNKKKDQKIHFSSHMNEEEIKKAEIVSKLLDENKTNYHFQPIVSARTGEVFAYEALMRPDHDPYIGPQTVIEYAEILGRLIDVEKATFFNVIRCINDNLDLFADRKVFINSIPGAKLRDDDRQKLIGMLKDHSDRIVIELIEQSEMDDNSIAEMKQEYSQLGLQSAIDDYGSGYSNIINLLKYSPDYIKIDRMIISGVDDNPQKQHFVKGIVAFARDNGFKVLSEGVETSAELRTSIELGVDYIQGYYTARPQAKILTEIDPMIREEIFRYNARIYGTLI